jgi:hypothetical protein
VFDTLVQSGGTHISLNAAGTVATVTYAGFYDVTVTFGLTAAPASGSNTQIAIIPSTTNAQTNVANGTPTRIWLMSSGSVYLSAGATVTTQLYTSSSMTVIPNNRFLNIVLLVRTS